MNKVKRKKFFIYFMQMFVILGVAIGIGLLIGKFISLIYPPAISFVNMQDRIEDEKPNDFISVSSIYDTGLVLNKRSRITRMENESAQLVVPFDYEILIGLGEAVSDRQLIAVGGTEGIYSFFDGRLIAVEKSADDTFILEFDLFSNYSIYITLQMDEVTEYSLIKSGAVDSVQLTINGYRSIGENILIQYDSVHHIYTMEISTLSCNPNIFEDYEVSVHALLQEGERYLLFPKSCYCLDLNDGTILAKKIVNIGNESQIIDVILPISPDIYFDDFYCVTNPNENIGEYLIG